MSKNKIPNILTNIRILMVFVIASLLIVYNSNHQFLSGELGIFTHFSLLILSLFLLASFTDYLDGHFARKWNVISVYGKLMDPLADKLLINTLFVMYAVFGLIHPVFPLIMIARDTLVDGLRMLALQKQIVIAASKLGKLKTVSQIIALSIVILDIKIGESSISLYFLILAAIISIASGISYFTSAYFKLHGTGTVS
jgi:CDP-diacylglycerol--glycerol-3-phosphate 3-phosphatidyltransferase